MYSFILLIFFSCQSPVDLKKEKNISKNNEIPLKKNFQIYVPEKNSYGDSIIQLVSELRDLKISIEKLFIKKGMAEYYVTNNT